jgi:plasmid maintenance system antidote protein VapI
VTRPLRLPQAPRRTQYWLTTAEAREKLGVTRTEFDKLIRYNRLVTIKVSNRIMVRTDTVKQVYMERMVRESLRLEQSRPVH